jgi:predicted component of type VI protein secretion system
MPAQLVGLTDGVRILVDKPIILMGRDAECDIQFESRKISRRHCCVALVGEQLVVRDLGSTNGVRINGVRVLEGYLKAGDELAIGNHRYLVSWDALPAGQERFRVKKVRDRDPSKNAPAPANDKGNAKPDDEPIRLADSALLPTPDAKAAGADDSKLKHDTAMPAGAEPFSLDIVPDKINLAPATEDFPALSPRQREARRNDKP